MSVLKDLIILESMRKINASTKHPKTWNIQYVNPDFNLEYESHRRTVKNSLVEEWSELQKDLKSLKKTKLEFFNSKKIKEIETSMNLHYIELMSLMDELKSSDSHNSLRKLISVHTSKAVQNAIDKSQNTDKCNRILLCEGKYNSRKTPICGWGCMMHHLLKCFRFVKVLPILTFSIPKCRILAVDYMVCLVTTCTSL